MRPLAVPPETPPAQPSATEADLALVDEVLAQRAPGLGLEQRNRIAVALVDECQRSGYDPMFVLAVAAVESDFDGAARSPKGARGLMQFMPITLAWVAEREGVRLTPEEIFHDSTMAVRLSIRYLKRLEDQFRNLDLALMAYNAGPNKLRLALHDGDAERFRGYARRVRTEYAKFRGQIGLAPYSAIALRWEAWDKALRRGED